MKDHKEIYYRPSKSFLAEQCPSSMWRNPDFIPKEQVGEPAHLGTACHDLFQNYVTQNMALTDEYITEVAKKHNVEVDGYNGLGWRARKLEKSYERLKEKGYLTTPTSEEEWTIGLKNGYQYRCFPDLYELHTPWAVVVELKTGQVDTGWEYQARDYALAMLKKFKDLNITHVYSVVFAPIIDHYAVKKYTREDLEAVEEKIVSSMEKVGQHYVTGSGCQYCDNLLNCPGIKRKISPMTTDIMNAGGLQKITGADVAKWRPMIKAMKKIVENYDDAESLLLDREGTIKLDDTSELFYREQYKKVIDAGKAISIMCDEFKVERDDYIEKLSIRNKDIEELSGMTAPPRGKGKQIKAVWLRLEEAGAMVKKLEKRKSTRPISLTRGGSNDGEK